MPSFSPDVLSFVQFTIIIWNQGVQKPLFTEIEENNGIMTHKLGDKTRYLRKVIFARSVSPLSHVTTAKREITPAIVSPRKLSTSREVDIVH